MACNAPLALSSEALFCFECSKSYRLNDGKTCRVCGKPVEETSDSVCAVCKNTKIHYISNVSRYLYKGCIKEAVQNMKFKRRKWIAFEFADAICQTVFKSYGDIAFDAVIPVPMTGLSEKKRGFNQSAVFAKIISEKFKIECLDKVLRKKPGTKTQSGLGRKERLLNVKNSYTVVCPEKVVDKVVLLADDVFTTGATLNECAKVIKKAGAAAVYCVTLASTVYDE